MTTPLPERLRALADQAPPTLSGPELWRAGRRRQRSRQLTALAVTGVLVLGTALLGYGNWRSQQPDPAAPPATQSGAMSIPDRFYQPSPWLPTTRAPGRLVALMEHVEEKHVFGRSSTGVVGIAAGSQRYSFLALPGASTDPAAVLSPDGLHVAYPITGPTTGEPTSATGGFAVLDLVDGKTRDYPIPTQQGINNLTLGWLSSTTLLADATYATTPHPSRGYPLFIRGRHLRLELGASHPVRTNPTGLGGSYGQINYPRGLALLPGPRHLSVLPPEGRHSSTIRLTAAIQRGALSDSASRFAGIQLGPRLHLLAGRIRGGVATLERVGTDSDWVDAWSWADSDRVLAVRYLQRPGGASRYLLESVNTATGNSAVVSVLPREDVAVAADALAHPHFVAAVSRQRPWNRSSLAWGVLAGVVSLAALVWFFAKGPGRGRR